LKMMILLIVALCCLAIIGDVMAQNSASDSDLTVLKQDSGTNFSKMNLTTYTAAQDFGIDAFGIGEAVKFTAPKPDWKVMQVRVAGWNGFNETARKVPSPNNFLIEIRDQNLNLLYRLADTQNAYFTFPAPVLRGIDIPSIPVAGDFYVIFYDRGAMVVGMELENGTGNSYFFDSFNGKLLPDQPGFTDKNNQTTNVNWVIRAAGE